jgi:DNA polymerase
MPKDILRIDYETYSDLNLKEVASSRYSRHSSTEVLMGAYEFNDSGQIDQWDGAGGQPVPKIIREALVDPEVEKWAWNASFEIQITNNTMGIESPIEQWKDSMILAASCSLPMSLAKAGPVIDLGDDHLKDKDGARLMRKFSIRKKSMRKANKGEMVRTYWYDDIEDYEKYLIYNQRDVRAEGAIARRLMQFGSMSEEEWDMWHMDQRINQAGLPINMDMVANASKVYHEAMEIQQARMNLVSGLPNASAPAQLKPWLQDRGYMFDDCQKAHIKTALDYFDAQPDHWEDDQWAEYCTQEDLKEVLALRLETSRSSIKKFDSLLNATDGDGMLRNVLQFCGAQRTWRWAGRVFQPQNLPRPEKRFEKGIVIHAKNVEHLDRESLEMIYGNVFDLLASTIRPAAQAPEGYMLADADLNAIENRVLGWMSGCTKILDVFKSGRDPYIDFATMIYDMPYDVLWHEYKVQGKSARRTIAKPGVLGCGYMLSAGEQRVNRQTGEIEATGLLGYAWGMHVKHFTQEQAKLSVDTFRREFHEVKTYWYGIEKAAKRCIRTGRPVSYGEGYAKITFDRLGPFLRMILPSGRALHYVRPRLEMVKAPWGDMKETITYEGLNDRKQWARMSTHPGKLTENADQAISRDLLAHGIKLAMWRGLDVRLHVHDQIITLSKEDKSKDELAELIDCMETPPPWAPDLPLGSAGFISPVFMKD